VGDARATGLTRLRRSGGAEKLEDLDRELEEGTISREEYLRRKQEIESGSLVY
jgi:hypothetical protein